MFVELCGITNGLVLFVTYLLTMFVVSQSVNTLGFMCLFCLIGVRYKSGGIAGTVSGPQNVDEI